MQESLLSHWMHCTTSTTSGNNYCLLQQQVQTYAVCAPSEGPILVKNNTIIHDTQSFEIIYFQNCPLAKAKTVYKILQTAVLTTCRNLSSGASRCYSSFLICLLSFILLRLANMMLQTFTANWLSTTILKFLTKYVLTMLYVCYFQNPVWGYFIMADW
jgi:hypothetical protein